VRRAPELLLIYTQPIALERITKCTDEPKSECQNQRIFRVGGAIDIDMRAPNGAVYPMAGDFEEIVPPEGLAFYGVGARCGNKPLFVNLNTILLRKVPGGRNAEGVTPSIALRQLEEVDAYLPILEDKTRRVTPTFDQLLDQLMENRKGVAEGALQRDEFLQPRESEDEAGLQVFSGSKHP
jgi:hypothetical protein